MLQLLSRNKYRIVKLDFTENLINRTNIIESNLDYIYTVAELNKPSEKVYKKQASIGYNIVPNGTVSPFSSMVLFENKLYKQNYTTSHPDKNVNYKTNLIIQATAGYAFIKMIRPTVEIEKGIFLSGHWPHGWYHWLIEILPKKEVYEFLPKKYKNYPLLIPKKIENFKNHISVLNQLFPNATLIYLEDVIWYKIKDLVWLDSPVISPPDFKHKRANLTILDTNFNWELMKVFKNRFLIPKNNFNPKKRIFLARTQDKRAYNQDEVYEILKKYDFEAVYLEKLTVEEQMNIMNGADFIAGPTGGAWANLIFCNEHTKGVIWMPDIVRNANFYANLAQLSNIELIHHYYPCKSNNWIEFMHSNETVVINTHKLEEIIINLLDTK
ncbi:MAG: glycosyltransferase family 61 protein [Flavobacteriales bacterium]|nr:glycosyltransferase family 61 protein [Flavobacteriales bacterium]MCW8937701.1 glycosyltransferase family 61 protein [Flavobacteriales bacterium]MCW8968582.1 glycosyltransferase family 61 protein [Flavobacteriales bacterium]MCW8990189.1 glycosyltransferase family 61 protein [Flavobacteriales bacterium]MCW9019907.1 glycosyltransferase family 61 protein [Flavobacteriales bacterium]